MPLPNSCGEEDKALVKLDDSKPVFNTDQELDFQIVSMIEKNDGIWRCNVCGKQTLKKSNIRQHAETHIDGVFHACHICGKNVSTRHNLQSHVSRQHS